MSIGHVLVIVGGLAIGALLVDRLLLAAEARGWIFWRRSPPSRGSVGSALQEIMSIYEPAQQHSVEERLAPRVDESDDDDPLDLPR